MGPEPDHPFLQGHRTLAAIVFSDVVNFSGIMSADEEHALKLVQRDVELMTRFCEQYEGRVLKFTGDGLLMYFHSAVQAVACALEIQQAIAAIAAKLPPSDILQHRIGIHLGDVFVSENDVMGDGVNIAARLQSEAEPGGICLSQIVYDVVKKRLALQATYLGPRELRHIQEAVPIYQIVLAAHSQANSLSDEAETAPKEPNFNGIANPQTAPGAAQVPLIGLAEETRKGLERLLTEKIGPIATVILQRVLQQADSYQDLIERLTNHIPASEQFSFCESVRRLGRKSERSPESLPSLPVNSSAQNSASARSTAVAKSQSIDVAGTSAIDPQFMKRCEQELTLAIGPIATLIVQRTLAQQPQLSRSQLVESLAKHITSPEAMTTFYRQLLSSP